MSNTTRMEQIKEIIDEYTKKELDKGEFNFDDCNAYTIALDLSLDRSNVSRILNQLFSNHQLIKIEGRPTLYVSKSVILDYYPTIELPFVIKKEDTLQNYLHVSSQVTQEDLLNMIGLNDNESLYFVLQKLAPYFLNPPIETSILIHMIGEQGTGKKYIVEELFRYAIKKRVYTQESKIFYINLGSLIYNRMDIFNKIQPEKNPIVVIENLHSIQIETLKSILIDLSFIYKNKGINHPLFLLLSQGTESLNLNELFIPTKLNIPSLENRTQQEVLGLILYSLLKLSIHNSIEIRISKNIVEAFLVHKYTYNCKELFQEIYKLISKALYEADTKPEILQIKESNVSHHIKLIHSNDESTIKLLNSLPDTIRILPTMNIEDIRAMYKKKREDVFLKTTIKEDPIIDNLIQKVPCNLDDSHIFEPRNDFEEKLKTTILMKDPNIMHFVGNILNEFSQNRISILKYQVDNSITISSMTTSIYTSLKYLIQLKCNFKLMKSETYLIEHIIEQSIRSITQSQTPTLIVCHETGISENYARKFNELSNSRRFYSLDYSKEWQEKGINPFVQKLVKIIKSINRRNGITLFVDQYPLTMIDSQLVLNLKMSLLSFSPVSAYGLYTIIDSSTQNVFSTKNYLRQQNKIKAFLEKDTLIQKKERDKNLEYMKELFPSLDIIKINEAFYRSLTQISNDLGMTLNNRIIVDFIFQGNCILENISKNNRPQIYDDYADSVLDTIKSAIDSQPEFKSLNLNLAEINMLYKSLSINLE